MRYGSDLVLVKSAAVDSTSNNFYSNRQAAFSGGGAGGGLVKDFPTTVFEMVMKLLCADNGALKKFAFLGKCICLFVQSLISTGQANCEVRADEIFDFPFFQWCVVHHVVFS